MSARAKAQALEALIEAHATELKLPTVKRRFRALAQEATREQRRRPPTSRPCSRRSTRGAPSAASAAG